MRCRGAPQAQRSPGRAAAARRSGERAAAGHPDGDGPARAAGGRHAGALRVAPSCRHTIAEYGCYQYPPGDAGLRGGPLLPLRERGLGAERSELPVKANDHAMDATRYALHTHLAQRRAAEEALAHLARRASLRER